MSKLAHSYQPTMDIIELRAAYDDGAYDNVLNTALELHAENLTLNTKLDDLSKLITVIIWGVGRARSGLDEKSPVREILNQILDAHNKHIGEPVLISEPRATGGSHE